MGHHHAWHAEVRYASWLAGFIAVALIVGLSASWAFRDGGTLHFLRSEQLIGTALKPGEEIDLTMVLKNGTRTAVTLMGAPGFCGGDGCAELFGFPQVVLPGGMGCIRVRFRAGEPGPFTHEIPVYTNCPTQPDVIMRFRGEVIETSDEGPRPPTELLTTP